MQKNPGVVITKLSGGLGNQMFQYAVAKNISLRTGKQLKCDTRSFTNNRERQFRLRHLGLSPADAGPADLRPFFSDNVLSKVRRAAGIPKYRVLKEQEASYFIFDPEVARIRSFGIYLDGYWQNPQYFEKIAGEVRRDFSLEQIKTSHREWISRLAGANSVAVHIRRGDFLNSETNKIHGILPVDYYEQAIAELRKRIEDPAFYFFSDDPEWCRSVFTDPGFEFVSGSSFSETDDLCLMKSCRHQITANSTFSWWAAWLNDYPAKVVVAPRQWFVHLPWNLQANNLIPSSWIRI